MADTSAAASAAEECKKRMRSQDAGEEDSKKKQQQKKAKRRVYLLIRVAIGNEDCTEVFRIPEADLDADASKAIEWLKDHRGSDTDDWDMEPDESERIGKLATWRWHVDRSQPPLRPGDKVLDVLSWYESM
jgi:hypothetical protein